jgi:dUTP pyrophosphatase
MKSGEFTSQYITQTDGSKVDDVQVQPHGVELTVDKVFKVSGHPVIKDGEYNKGSREEAPLNDGDAHMVKERSEMPIMESIDSLSSEDYDDDELISMESPHYVLHKGAYVVRYNEKIRVPDDHVGFVIPRSRVIRTGNNLSTAVWDSGYEGRGEGGLHIHNTCFLEKGMRIAQFVLMRATVYQQYEGSHQEENIEDTS